MAEVGTKQDEKPYLTATPIGHDAAVGFRMGSSSTGGVHVHGAEEPQRRPGADPRYDVD